MVDRTAATSYRWDELPADHPLPLLDRRRIIGEQAMLSHVRLGKGCVVPSHQHDNEQFAWVVSGRIRFGLGAEQTTEHREMVLVGGEVLHLPSGVPHSAKALEDTVIVDVFAPPSTTTGIDRT